MRLRDLTGRVALVTGSTDGVGRVVALRFSEAGAPVLVHGRDAERGIRIVADIEKAGGAVTFFRADLASVAEVRRLPPRSKRKPAGSTC